MVSVFVRALSKEIYTAAVEHTLNLFSRERECLYERDSDRVTSKCNCIQSRQQAYDVHYISFLVQFGF